MFSDDFPGALVQDAGGSRSGGHAKRASIRTRRARCVVMSADGLLPAAEQARRAAYVEAFDSAIEGTMASMARMVVELVAHQFDDPTPPSADCLSRWWIYWKAESRKSRSARIPRPNQLRTFVWEMLDGISGPECRVLHYGSAPIWAAYLMGIVVDRGIALPGGRPSTRTMVRLIREYRKARRPAPRSRSRRATPSRSRPWPVPPACPEVFVKEVSA